MRRPFALRLRDSATELVLDCGRVEAAGREQYVGVEPEIGKFFDETLVALCCTSESGLDSLLADLASSGGGALLEQGPAAAARKVGEEGVEAALAGAAESDERLIEELADLWFHSYVLLAARGLDPAAVEDELARRSR